MVGGNILSHLLEQHVPVLALARNAQSIRSPATGVSADLSDKDSLIKGLKGKTARHVYFTTWKPEETEQEACEVNSRYMRNFFDAAREIGLGIDHVSLVTGLKHYLGPFADFGKVMPDTPFQEDSARLDLPNFYYAQEDVLFDAAKRSGFSWSVHRPNSIIGFGLHALMNMGLTLACYAALCRETGQPFLFSGVPEQWDMLTEVSDARQVASQTIWAANTPAAAGQAYNTANGDVFRWRSMWPVLARYFGLKSEPYGGSQLSLSEMMADADKAWRDMATKYNLIEPNLNKLAKWWHCDADFGRNVECISDMSRSRALGFNGYQNSRQTFTDLFSQLTDAHIIPAFSKT
jgi:nucleoside-diphosphate-sugar epimerase